MKNWTLAKIQQFIDDQIEESNSLDYKAADALDKSEKKKNELSKDVSAFANSNGGVIIYGVSEFDEKEKSHLPKKINPVNRVQISKEWLEQVISTKIQPKIEGVEIIPITVSEQDNTVIYVVEIPKSTTAHQAAGHKYYKRYNFQSEPMMDYEIRDVMNRATHPSIILDFEIEIEKEAHVRSISLSGAGNSAKTIEGKTHNTLKIYAKNIGKVYANYVNYYIELNRNFLEPEEYQYLKTFEKDNSGKKYVEYYGENTIRDIFDVKTVLAEGGAVYKYGPSRFDPILPGMHSRADRLRLTDEIDLFKEEYIEWKVYADNAIPKTGKIKISDIPVIEKSRK